MILNSTPIQLFSLCPQKGSKLIKTHWECDSSHVTHFMSKLKDVYHLDINASEKKGIIWNIASS